MVESAARNLHAPKTPDDYALGLAYKGVLDSMQFNKQRRINLATGVGEQSLKAFVAWLAIFGTAKSLPIDYKAAVSILETISVWLPVFGMLLSCIYMGIDRSVYQDEVNYIVEGLRYEEERAGSYGSAHTRYTEIVNASYLRPATTEIAGFAWFSFWFVVALTSLYYTL